MAKTVRVEIREADGGDTYIITNHRSGNSIWVRADKVDKDLADHFEAILNGDADPSEFTITCNEAKYLYGIRDRQPDTEVHYSLFPTKASANCHGCGTYLEPSDEGYPKRNGFWMCEECVVLTDAEIQANYQAWKRHNGVR
jgi:hypothetical protein